MAYRFSSIVSDKPAMSKRLAPEERVDFENHEDIILSDDGRATPSLGYYMKQPMVWATTLAFFSYNYILFFFLTWFPSYLNHSLHLDIKEISIATVIPWVIGAIGMVLGGVCSDVIYRITGNALLSRRLILGVCLAGAAVCVAVSGTVSDAQYAKRRKGKLNTQHCVPGQHDNNGDREQKVK